MQNSGQLLLLGVLLVFLVWTYTRGRRQQRETQATQSRLRPGSEVMMTSGLHGMIVELTDDGLVRLETSPGVVSRWDRRAVARVLSTPEALTEDTEGRPPEPADLEPPRPADVVEPVRPAHPVQEDTAPHDRD